jgi:hypothetical protein
VSGTTIKRTLEHDAGAVARCSFCGRYTDRPDILRRNWTKCDCGKPYGWSGSFEPPTDKSEWCIVASDPWGNEPSDRKPLDTPGEKR